MCMLVDSDNNINPGTKGRINFVLLPKSVIMCVCVCVYVDSDNNDNPGAKGCRNFVLLTKSF